MELKNKYLWFAVSGFFLALLIYFSDIEKFLNAISNADPLLLVPALILGLSAFLVWGYVWHLFFRQMNLGISFHETMEMFMAGNFLNSVTPLGQFGGEPFMAYIVSKNTDASYEKSLSFVISADIINAVPFVTYLLAGAGYMFLFRSVNNIIAKGALLAISLATIGGILVYLLWFDDDIIEKYLFSALNKVQKVTGHGDKLSREIKERISSVKSSFRQAGKSPRMLLKATAITHTNFIFQCAVLYFILLSLSLTPEATAIYFTVLLTGLADFSPTPGGTGAFEAAFAGVLLLFYPVGFATALTAAILFRLSGYWPGLIVGYVAFVKLNIPEREK